MKLVITIPVPEWLSLDAVMGLSSTELTNQITEAIWEDSDLMLRGAEVTVSLEEDVAEIIVRRARSLLGSPESWTLDSFAVDSDGRAVLSSSALAVAWSGEGALRKAWVDVTGGGDDVDYYSAYNLVAEGFVLDDWCAEEGRTHAEVLALFDAGV